MKKIILPVLALAALIVTSCAKEKDGYDKNLTSDTWNLSTATIVNKTITANVYSDGTDNTTVTSTNTTEISGGVSSREEYNLNQEVGSTDLFTRQIDKSDFSLSYKFEKEGTYKADRTEKLTSVTNESTGTPSSTVTVTNQPATSSNTGLWNWNNTGDQKSILTFDLGSLQVEKITKSELSLKLNTSETEVTKPNSALTKTVTKTNTVSITMTR
jgi:hypothetical protein